MKRLVPVLASLAIAVPACSSDATLAGGTAGTPGPRAIGCATCTSITGGLVFDGTKAAKGVVVLDGSTIAEVAFDDVTVTAGAAIDATGSTVMPGMIDMHVHTPGTAGPYGFFPQEDQSEDHLKAMLRAGVTSYLDLGTQAHVIFELRDRSASKRMLAPRIFAAGPLLTPTGGHPCYSGSPAQDFCVFVDQPSDVDAALAELLPQKPDVIKIVIDSGAVSALPQMKNDVIAAVVSKAPGHEVIAHVGDVDDVEDALAAGVTRFAHVPFETALDATLAQKLAAAKAIVVPTLAVGDALFRVSHGMLPELEDPKLGDDVPADVIAALGDKTLLAKMQTPDYQAKSTAWRANAIAGVKALREAGVTIVAGTDAGNPGTFHGLALSRELALYIEAGMKPLDALVTATRAAADALGRSDLGRLEKGATADVLVVAGDATADIGAVAHPTHVWKDGAAIDRDALALPKKTSLVTSPTTGQTAGETCLAGDECATKLTCDFFEQCEPSCSTSATCAEGSSCVQGAPGSQGFCWQGDGCDPIAQDCKNGEACIFFDNAATLCWYASAAVDGEACTPSGGCAPGYECDFQSGKCRKICDPKTSGGCSMGTTCVDFTAFVGISVGECQ